MGDMGVVGLTSLNAVDRPPSSINVGHGPDVVQLQVREVKAVKYRIALPI
jgi:hypothetical protein